jgi:protein-disulfide isomerase
VSSGLRLALGIGLTAGTVGLGGVIALGPHPRHDDARENHESSGGHPPGKEAEMTKNIAALVLAAGLATHTDGGALAGTVRALPPTKVPRFWTPLGVGPVKGPPTAKVTIVAFMDYQSPFCLSPRETGSCYVGRGSAKTVVHSRLMLTTVQCSRAALCRASSAPAR